MRIIIAASIYPPEVGGPSQYAAELAASLKKQGHDTAAVVFSAYRKFPSGVRHALYALALLERARGADAIIAFDTFTVGAPAAAVSVLTGVPVIARVGGDFLWERYVERTGDLVPLPQFYSHRSTWSAKEKFVFALARWAARRVHVAFSSPWIADIWREPYGLEPARVHVIENPIPPRLEPRAPQKKNFIMFGRQIALKNAPAFRRAFDAARASNRGIVLEEGILPYEEFIERLRECYAAVLPSVSEVTPNYIIDAIRCGKPFLLTKYSGYAQRFDGFGILIDPLDERDMARGVKALADAETYDRLRARIAQFKEVRTYEGVAREFADLARVIAISAGGLPR